MRPTFVYLLLLELACQMAFAGEDPGGDRFFPTESEKEITFFERNSWVGTVQLSVYLPEDRHNRDIRFRLAGVGAEKYVFDNLGFVAEAFVASSSGHIVHGDDDIALPSASTGIGGSLGLKWHFLRGESWSVFVNGSVGLLFTNRDFPSGGTRLNAMSRADIGFTLRIRPQWHLLAGAGLIHVSNGQGLNEENPSFNGEGGYIGLVHRFDMFGLFD